VQEGIIVDANRACSNFSAIQATTPLTGTPLMDLSNTNPPGAQGRTGRLLAG